MKKNFIKALVALFAGFFMYSALSGFKPFQEKKPWPVPDNYKKMKNPIASDAESIAAGKTLWSTHCKSCHGTKGLGDGPKAAQLKTEPGDFSKTDVQTQADGALFYKTSEGREDMPSFKKKIPDQEDIWSIVNFIRSLKK
jgi:mono/diheme cytochrome c family protein